MAQIIDLAAKHAAGRVYRQLLAGTLGRLEAAADMLEEDLVNLAMRGPWRNWSEAQQMGAVANINDEALAECGDANVVALNQALRRLREVVVAVRGEGSGSER
jgi:hypothetical protein